MAWKKANRPMDQRKKKGPINRPLHIHKNLIYDGKGTADQWGK